MKRLTARPCRHRTILDVAALAKLMRWPVEHWPGNCYAVCWRAIEVGAVRGDLRYGHFRGRVAPSSMFAHSLIRRHGWVELPDGRVWDATRWVFESAPPSIYVGLPGDEYDVGGQIWNMANLRAVPPISDADKPDMDLRSFDGGQGLVRSLLHIPDGRWFATVTQVFWIANAPPCLLGEHIRDIYEGLKRCRKLARVPIDYQYLVYGPPRPELKGGSRAARKV